ncbi:TPA: hypothetical protein ACMDVO_003620 [Vibrio cholerae]|uniref:hypothetical protein n=1 Tax=Vibrio cholerae TaxID=666 RepID=UPI00226DB4B8|nr:hypothetical protein [Vibrio cholerae]MCX9437020.1 hypothetical protein [Vibrio cholerae]HDI3164426.1 hypothetical protein [Vibrio cholerae]
MDRITSGPRMLTAEERQELRRDMAESSACAKAELRRRREEKHQKIRSIDSDGGKNESET